MKRNVCYFLILLLANFITIVVSAQNITITGNVENSSTMEKVPAVSVTIKGATTGTFTDDKGNFKISTTQQLPVTLFFTSIGYELQEVTVTTSKETVVVKFKPSNSLGQEVVVSASRLPERILESPVTIERIGLSNIRNTPTPNYYDILKTLKGVDVVNSSLTFTSVTTRGFSGSGNNRVNQFVDGMDNQAPGLNFSVGSIVGPNELDVDNVELLPGASSALYGSGGMNGTLLISSKNPFKYQGLSFQVKQGIMHINSNDPIGASPYYDWSVRWGKKVCDKFAFKVGSQFIQAKDWVASDESNYIGLGTLGKVIPGTRASDPNYNGVNVYGDESLTSATMFDVANSVQDTIRAGILAATGNTVDIVVAMDTSLPAIPTQAQIGAFISKWPVPLQESITKLVPFYFGLRNKIIPKQNVSRTGYQEKDIIDNKTWVLKLNGGVYYKITPKTELSAIANYGTGNSVYTGSDRYSLKNLIIAQYKVELKNDQWFLKAYTTQENSGDAFNATVATELFNEAWKPTATWYPQYVGAYVQAISLGADQNTAFANARVFADQGRPAPGTDQFKSIFNKVVSIPIPKGGQFLDRTDLYHVEGQYNLSQTLKFAEVLVGANWRQYQLNSKGTLFADTTGVIKTNEYGAYLQVSKKIINNKLKLTASGRYDKNDNFDGKFTPRFSAVFTVVPNHNIRAFYQNAYRFPSNQNQWINLNTGSGILIGGLPSLRDFYDFNNKPLYTPASAMAFIAGGGTDPSLLVKETFGTYKPESVNSYELGYKGLFHQKILIDVYGYYAQYKDFIGRVLGLQIATGTGFSVSVNSSNKVNTYGYGIGINWLLPKNFAIDANFSGDNIDNPDPAFITYFNSPKYRVNIGVLNTGFGYNKRFGFNAQYRWQDAYFTESDFKQGNISAVGTIDAQVSYKLRISKSLLKVGATNLFNHYYKSAYGNPAIGGLYYVSFGYNIF